jgi:hypothetical protein
VREAINLLFFPAASAVGETHMMTSVFSAAALLALATLPLTAHDRFSHGDGSLSLIAVESQSSGMTGIDVTDANRLDVEAVRIVASADRKRSTRVAQKTAERARKVELGRPFEIRPMRVPRGDVMGHSCLRGTYIHQYRTSGEVWLCCIPVNEILSESFQCAGARLSLLGSSDYMKIRYCSLLHPTASEPTFIPVCIPAPVQAPIGR